MTFVNDLRRLSAVVVCAIMHDNRAQRKELKNCIEHSQYTTAVFLSCFKAKNSRWLLLGIFIWNKNSVSAPGRLLLCSLFEHGCRKRVTFNIVCSVASVIHNCQSVCPSTYMPTSLGMSLSLCLSAYLTSVYMPPCQSVCLSLSVCLFTRCCIFICSPNCHLP